MKIADRSWWFLIGVVFAPVFLLVTLLQSYWLMRLDLRFDLDLHNWIWFTLAMSLAVGLGFVWRLPIHWFLRLDISVLYALFAGYWLLMAANRFAANLS